MNDSLVAETIRFQGHGGDEIEAYLARPTDDGVRASVVVVIHHMPGYDRATKEIVRRFAELGYNAICRTCTGARRRVRPPTMRRRRRGPRAACLMSASWVTSRAQ